MSNRKVSPGSAEDDALKANVVGALFLMIGIFTLFYYPYLLIKTIITKTIPFCLYHYWWLFVSFWMIYMVLK